MGTVRKLRRAVFLDRDGVINDGGKLNTVGDLRLLPGAAASLRRLKRAGFVLVVVTNQGGLGEDLNGNRIWKAAPLTREDLAAIHGEMLRQLGAEAAPDLIKFCPHSKSIDCQCRKPAPGMLLAAAAELGIDLATSYMVGDMASDIEAGIAAGCRSILVLTGFDKSQTGKCPAGTIAVPSINEAADLILSGLAPANR
jgi:D-glycero-D-manno-heptose 1,7-bisphosphate phosphatase